MHRTNPTRWTQIARAFLFATAALCAAQLPAAPVHLRVDRRVHPIGLGDLAPTFSWQSDATTRNWKQSAYQIYVADSTQALARGDADVWNSGRIASADSINIPYQGPALQATHRYYWAVRVWDAAGKSTQAAEPAYWEMGLLAPTDWQAHWIRGSDAAQQAVLDRIHWLWLPKADAAKAPQGTRAEFRYRLHLDRMPGAASMHVYAGGSFTAKVNGITTGHKDEWSSFDREDIRNPLRYGSGAAGDNTIVIEVDVPSSQDQATFPAAAAVAIRLGDQPGRDKWIVSDGAWQARQLAPAAPSAPPQAVPEWMPVQVVGPLASGRFGVAPDRTSPAAAPNRVAFDATLLRKNFNAPRAPVSARLYITALGSYRAYLNGEPVDADRLTPGFTDYRKRVLYQTYDVTHLVRAGQNTLGAVLGAGWYGSPLLWSGTREFPGPDRLRAQLEITYADGTRTVIATDSSWHSSSSPILDSTIYDGEAYDARLVQPGWKTPAFHPGQSWGAAVVDDADVPAEVSAQPDQPVHQQLTVAPIAVTMVRNPETGKKDAVFNMGQNMVGVVRLRVHGPRGTIVQLRFAERLNADGTVYTKNLRNAYATDTYTLSGDGEEQWSPDFTYHGFQYVEVSGYPGKPPLSAIEGLVWNSLPEVPSMRLATSSALLNSMDKLGLWGQRGNFVSIPTDCPQRDERMGWMGDAGVFWRTGAYNFDIDAFSHKFVQDQDDAQTADGAFTNISPNLLTGAVGDQGAPGWGDAGVIVPYQTWLQYGDLAVLKQAWPGMTRWMNFILRTNPDYLRRKDLGPDYGDWLAPDPHTPGDLVGTAYWALVARQMQTMATALGRTDEARKYGVLYDDIRTAYQRAYIGADGKMPGDTQTDYVVTLYAGLAPAPLVSAMTGRLVANIQAHKNHLTTGFLGTPFLLSALDANGRTDVAYTLLLTKGYPSWGYMVSKGATTWWERWNGDTGDPAMNSYNHYSFGSVMAWVYRRVAGIDTDPGGAGFHHILIRPYPDARLAHLQASYASAYGLISTEWTLDRAAQGGAFHLTLNLPANTGATVDLPGKAGDHVLQDGKPVTLPYRDGAFAAEVGSGAYKFTVHP
jgi:alpha-L-rhamnosidase